MKTTTSLSFDRQREQKRRHQRLTRAQKNPYLALDNGWYEDPEFCRRFFDRCEHQTFILSPGALELARRAVQIADVNGDPHLRNDSLGVLSHAYLARSDPYWAGKVLADCRRPALRCCRHCRSEHLRRQGDLLGELRQAEASIAALRGAIAERGRDLDRDTHGRIRYLLGIAHHFAGDRGRALEAAGRSLLDFDLEAPRGYFLDTPALLAIYVGGGDPRHDRIALGHVERFAERIRGRRRWKDVRTRMAWVKGHLHARLGDLRRARLSLESAQVRLLADGLAREAVAVTIDVAQLRTRHWDPWGGNRGEAERAIERCLGSRADLRPEHRQGLTEMVQRVLAKFPQDAFAELEALRSSFIAPVPGRLGERLAPDEAAR